MYYRTRSLIELTKILLGVRHFKGSVNLSGCRVKSNPFLKLLADGAAFEVEFSDRNEQTYESVGLRLEQIMVLYLERGRFLVYLPKNSCNSHFQSFYNHEEKPHSIYI